ncbi:MAG: SurA N-terminal domain-containing protein [Proteobacteria bacterium]|nr:SurA N-terminal domain-containing protein [Pseudomonadota bacterium]
MLQGFRDRKNSVLIYIVFAAIIAAFIFMFGLPSTDSSCLPSGNKTVARIGKHVIDAEVMRSMILRYYGDNVFQSQNLPQIQMQIVDGLAVIYLLADEARSIGLRISDEDLHAYLTNVEAGNLDIIALGFLKNNKFSRQQYEYALQRIQTSSRRYEAFKREELLARRYMALVRSGLTISDTALWQAYSEANTFAALEVVRLTPDAVRMTLKPVSEAELSAFLTTGEDEIQAHYDAHLGQYTTPEKVKLQQIVIQKDYSKLTNVGARTVKTHQPGERFNIARYQIVDEKADFAQAFEDYDESEFKATEGVTGLIAVDQMADALQAALENQEVGEIVTAELSDRFVIAKVLERTPRVVTPLAEVRRDIAKSLLDERQVRARMEEVSANILHLVQNGQTLEAALAGALYTGVLFEQPTMVVPVEAEEVSAEDAVAEATSENEDESAVAADAGEATEPPAVESVVVKLPTDLPIVPKSQRLQVQTIQNAALDTGFIMGLGVSDDIVRDARTAEAGTILPRAYGMGHDLIIVKVTEKMPASQESFETQKAELRDQAIYYKALTLIGDPDTLLSMQGEPGLWLRQKLQQAKSNGTITINQAFFAEDARRRAARN